MGGGDLNAKKAWHPNTLKNQERVWKAEQAAAEEKKRIAELERERHQERERAELNKLAKSNMALSSLSGDDRLHWMYEKPDKKVQQEEYLLGKAIDKSHGQTGKSEADEIPAVSRRVVGSSLMTVSGDTQVDLARKMREDPLLLVKERERAARAALLNNPVQRAKLAELLRKEQATNKESKSKKKKKKSKDLDNILAEKLQALSGNKGIDLASLLASGDSSSESSNEKSKKKRKKKKTKNKKDKLHDSDIEKQIHKAKYDSNRESKKVKQKRESSVSDNDHAKKNWRHHSIEHESDKLHVKKYNRGSSEDHSSSDYNDSEKLSHKSKYISKYDQKRTTIPDKLIRTNKRDSVVSKTKRRRHSIDSEQGISQTKKHCRDSIEYQSSYDQQSRDGQIHKKKEYVKEERYWNYKQYSSKYQTKHEEYIREERYSKKETHSKNYGYKYEREGRYTDAGSNRDSKNSQGDKNNEKTRRRGPNNGPTIVGALDEGWRNNKRGGLSEAEKASKLAEMVAAGVEREKQRERRVADQLAEKEIEDRPSSHCRSRNVIHQLPDSLESRIHSNRHYIQRDQRHMNENFARR